MGKAIGTGSPSVRMSKSKSSRISVAFPSALSKAFRAARASNASFTASEGRLPASLERVGFGSAESKLYKAFASSAAEGAMAGGDGGRDPGSFIAKRLGGGVEGGVVDPPKRFMNVIDIDAADVAEAEFARERGDDGRWESATTAFHMIEIRNVANDASLLFVGQYRPNARA